jgi:FdhE protein
VLRARTGFDQWRRGTCPLCGGAPDFAAIAAGGQRRLICGRCHTTWPVDALACPFCGERDAGRITSLATAGGPYRVAACTSCGRYLKAIDTRRAGRAVIPAVDAIATLPLDAVILRRGFTNG